MIKTYVKRITTLAGFGLGLVVLLLVTSYIFMPKSNNPQGGMEATKANGILGEEANTIDMVVVGDSETYASITPMQMWKDEGFTSYVCGSAKQTLDYSMIMLERTFENQNPKIVILETNALYREISKLDTVLTELGNVFTVFKYHDRWKTMTADDFKWDTEYSWTDDYKGYKYTVKSKPSTKKDHMAESDQIAEIPEFNAEYVKEIKEYCEENGAKLVLLSTPSTKNWNSKRHNAVVNLAAELECEYIDMNLLNDEIQIDWETDTRDKGDHLKYYGACKVTKYLSNYLKETGLMSDRRQEPECAKWNEALVRYEDKVTK